MSILLTGHSGFLGKIIHKELERASIAVQTLGRSSSADIQWDFVTPTIELSNYERVIHVAGKAHSTPKSDVERQLFFQINEFGTIKLCEALERTNVLPKQFVFISTVAVYGIECGHEIRETTPLEGSTPYAISKINAEKYLLSWGKKNSIKVLILRLPLIVGENPPGNLGKMEDAIRKSRYVSIGKGNARKSMVLASDVAQLIIKSNDVEGIYNLTDGYHPSFYEIEKAICRKFNTRIRFRLPIILIYFFGKTGDVLKFFPVNTHIFNKMTSDLVFNDDLARRELGWNPKRVIDNI